MSTVSGRAGRVIVVLFLSFLGFSLALVLT